MTWTRWLGGAPLRVTAAWFGCTAVAACASVSGLDGFAPSSGAGGAAGSATGGEGGSGGAAGTTSSTSGSGGSGGAMPEGPTCMEAMTQFGDCNTFDNWVGAGVPEIGNAQTPVGPCHSCHATGAAGIYLPDPSDTAAVAGAFQAMRYPYASFVLVRCTVNDTDGSFKELVLSYGWRDKGLDVNGHPMYDLPQTYIDSFEQWFSLTHDRWVNARQTGMPCDPADGDPP